MAQKFDSKILMNDVRMKFYKQNFYKLAVVFIGKVLQRKV